MKFGIYEFDEAKLELRREGVLVRLQAQPAQVLATLLATPGELVTREELQRAVWGEATHVDFDRGLNFCVAQIRQALRDSAESPRFIRTVPKQGYQFIAPVALPPVAKPRPRRLRWATFAAVAAILAAMIAARAVYRPEPTIVVIPFDNETGAAENDHAANALTDSLTAELTALCGRHCGVIGNAAEARVQRQSRDLNAIGRALNAQFVVLGQVQSAGTGTRVLSHLIRLPEQTHLNVVRFELPSGLDARVAPIAHETGTAFAKSLGVSPPQGSR